MRLFSVDEIGDSEMIFGEMRPKIRHRLPGIHLTITVICAAGLGSSLVLTQVEVMLHCHYPTQGRLPNCVPQLGNALAHFATPLLLLAFTSAYGSSWAPLLQAGIVMQGILGAATFVAHVKRPPAIARYRVRPRAFTVLNGDGESQSILARDSYINASFSGANSPSSNRTWRSLSPTTEEPEFIVSSGNTPLTHEMNYRCNKNQFGVDILPEIPEESEDDVESDYNTKIEVHEVPQTGNSDINVNEVPQTTHTRSLDNYLDTNKMYPNSIEDGVENKRWSIGTVEEILPMCVENGLSLLVSKNEGKSDAFNSHQKSNENISQKIKEEGKVSDLSIKSEAEISPFDTKDTREFDPILSNSIDIPSVHVIRNSGSDFRKVKSLDEVPLFDKENLTNQEDILKKDIIVTSGDGGSRYLSDDNLSSNDQVGSIMKEINTFRSLELPDEVKNRLKRWSIGTLGEVKSENDRSNLGKLEGLESNGHRKWRSAEFGENREPKDQFSDKLSQTRVFTFEIDDSIANRNNVVLGEYQGADNVGSSSSGSGDSEHPLWVAKLVSSENMTVESTSGSNEENSSLRNWYRRPSTLSHALRRLRFSCTCQFYRRHSFRRRYPRNRFASILLYYFLEPLSVPYFFPSLLLRFALRLCPMGFAALAPSLTKDIIPEITNEEAVFSVSISGFVWLCFLLVTPWCTRMHHSRKKYLFAAGSLVSSYGLHLLSKAETHDRVTLSCAVFGLGQGATMVTGNNMVREVLGTWNLAKADVFLDLTSGVLVLGASSIMGLYNTRNHYVLQSGSGYQPLLQCLCL
ncbi:hypothetical protein ANN_01524 [Periplaneta americana]|uniref:Uncharacterized protein n=1 Tax=Periplaneta americana TaxID=6978 RepID=A0ABQ8TTS5_PERAM|nr:hypothetical protein ANN_01524 [Periplaneta americana]